MNTARMTFRRVNEQLFGSKVAALIDMVNDNDEEI
jgi:hypothetical protein